jgi:MraZ protein
MRQRPTCRFWGQETFACKRGLRVRVSDRQLFKGHVLNAIDAKGRVAIPASLRSVIERNGDGRFLVLGVHDADPCLIGYDRGWSNLLHDRLERQENRERDAGRPFDYHNSNRRAFGSADEVPYDSSGRFILPTFLRMKARLDDLALFVGTGNTFEIWNPRLLLDTDGIDDVTKELAAFLISERGSE